MYDAVDVLLNISFLIYLILLEAGFLLVQLISFYAVFTMQLPVVNIILK